MTKVLFERVKTETGTQWHIDIYKCSIVSNWLHLFCRSFYTYETRLDNVDYFVIYKIVGQPYYKTVEQPYYKTIKYMKDDENIIEWLKNNIHGMCKVIVKIDVTVGLDYKVAPLPMDIRKLTVHFTSEIDAMAFKLRFIK